ncbi:MAG: hypothetical protein ACE5NL_01020 [Candidatus Hydrothermarchaeaceae archaeon]
MARLFTEEYAEEITGKDIAEWAQKQKDGRIVDDVPGGTDVSVPIRVDYMNGDFRKAWDMLKKKNVPLKYKTVMTVPPFHATIHVFPMHAVEAMKILKRAGIKMYKAKPVF